MKVIVGLGNPGKKYLETRHNVGFEVVARLSQRFGGGAVMQKFESEVVEVSIGGEQVLLVAPQTYMNLSGRAVGQLCRFYKLPPEELLVVCDDLNLPLGRLRLRSTGSSGGQKGLKDIIQQCGTECVPRLRIGIGRPAHGGDTVNYVLQRFPRGDREVVDEVVEAAASGAASWVSEEFEQVMSRLNGLDFSSSRAGDM